MDNKECGKEPIDAANNTYKKILAVDDESLVLDNLIRLLNEVLPEAEVIGFTNPNEACLWTSKHTVDVVLLDIEMNEINGIALAKKLKCLCPDINIIFVTAHTVYALEAFQLHASGYLVKPVRAEDLRTELNHLRNPLPYVRIKTVRVQTFGNFEIFVNEKPLAMLMGKRKECLAYLIDRKGALVTKSELATILWGDILYDRRVQNNIHRVIADMIKILKKAGVSDIIINTRKEIAIDIEKVDCDYYRFLKGDVSEINAFHGEYMSNYGWSEFTLAGLVETGKNNSTPEK